jgi:hypothetical protein
MAAYFAWFKREIMTNHARAPHRVKAPSAPPDSAMVAPEA